MTEMERRQRGLMLAIAAEARTSRELTTALWTELSSEGMRPFVRLFFEVVGAASADEGPRPGLTDAWPGDAAGAVEAVGVELDPALLRAVVAVTRGLLLDLVSGANPAEVHAAHAAFVDALLMGGAR